MKKMIAVFLFTLAVTSVSHAQTSPESCLANVPAIPQKACKAEDGQKAQFEKSVRALMDKVDKELFKRREDVQTYREANREAIAARLERQPGSVEKTTAKSAKWKQEKQSRSADIQRTAKIHKPAKTKPVECEQKELTDKLNAGKAAIWEKFKAIDRRAAQTRDKELAILHRQLSATGSIVVSRQQSEEMARLASDLKLAQCRYCETYGPEYLSVLNEYYSFLNTSLSDFNRLDEINAIIQMGLARPIDAGRGLTGLEEIREYLTWLAQAYKFDLPCEY